MAGTPAASKGWGCVNGSVKPMKILNLNFSKKKGEGEGGGGGGGGNGNLLE